MSVQNVINITEANLHQTLEQSVTAPVLFYFWSARSQHCEQLTPVLEGLAAQYNGQFTLGKWTAMLSRCLPHSLACAQSRRFICSRTASR